MKLHEIRTLDKNMKKKSKRVGRGIASGTGKTSGRGTKGQKSRSGYNKKRGFEGGQMPLIRRVPKKGVANIFSKKYSIVNIEKLNQFEESSIITIDDLLNKRIIRKLNDGVKILGKGEISKKITIQCNKISEAAKNKIELVGGKVEVI